MNEWAQSDHGPYKIYRDLPEEHDAHEIEDLVKTRITQAIGFLCFLYQSNLDGGSIRAILPEICIYRISIYG